MYAEQEDRYFIICASSGEEVLRIKMRSCRRAAEKVRAFSRQALVDADQRRLALANLQGSLELLEATLDV
jgi:hypothetical protein